MKHTLLLLLSFFVLAASAQTSLYLCKDGSYTGITSVSDLVFADGKVSIKGVDYKPEDIDSLLLHRPSERSVVLDLTDFIAKGHTVEGVFVRDNAGGSLCTNDAMKNSKAASSSASDVCLIRNVGGSSAITCQLGTGEYKNGFTFTVQYDGGKLLTMSDTEPMARATFYRKYAFTDDAAMQNAWMATIPSKVFVHMLCLPGAHDAATKGVSAAQGRCQGLSISQLLDAGVRALDLRPRYTASKESDIQLDNLEIYHGITATGVLFKDAVSDIVAFLDANPTEMVLVNLLKEKASGNDYSAAWRTSVRTCLRNHSSHVVQKLTSSLTLGDCRGKMLVISHNPYGSENVFNDIVYGALTAEWQDNATFTTNLLHTGGSVVSSASVTDEYNATDTSVKQGVMSKNLAAAAASTTGWYFSFMNVAWKLFGSNPDAYARTHNAWLASQLGKGTWKGRLGVVFFDFCAAEGYTPSLVQDIVSHNYTYIY